MSLSVCTSCLARLRIAQVPTTVTPITSRIPASISSFHSSVARHNVVKKKTTQTKGANAPKLRESRSARINKKQKVRPKPPPVGQRRAERRRIVLSNTNALEVQRHDKLTTGNMSDSGRIGRVLALDGPLLDQLREAKAFKTTQNWNLFRTPSTLHRSETVEVACDIEDVKQDKSTLRRLVVGEKGSGKSVHLLQAMTMAYMNRWIVVNVPDCQEYVNNQSPYTAAPKSDENAEQMYNQHQLASDLLSRLAHSNAEVLSELSPVHDHTKVLRGRKIKSLKDLAMLGTQDVRHAPEIWDALWKELTIKSDKSPRPPILVAVDGVNFFMTMTKYRSPDYSLVHAHQFTLIKQFVSLLFNSTKNALPNGGIVMACTTKSNHPPTPSFDLLTKQVRAQQNGLTQDDSEFPLWDPYSKGADQRVYDLLRDSKNTGLTELKGLSRPESKGLLEYFAESGVFREAVTDSSVNEKWTLSGGGIVGELCKMSARIRKSMFAVSKREAAKIRA